MEKISQGAEGILYKDSLNDSIIKERVVKTYRVPELDRSLRGFRTRREAKVLDKLQTLNFPAPHLKEFCDKRMSITMDFVPGEKLRDIFSREGDHQKLAKEMGERIGMIHQSNIIHGDLTTSNMILHTKTNKINFIDFGLSFFSEKVEDKAVDLFLLERSLESTHYHIFPGIFEQVLQGYKSNYPLAHEVLQRFEQVRARGRNKNKD